MGRNSSYAIYKNREYEITLRDKQKVEILSHYSEDLKDGFKMDENIPVEGTFVKWVGRNEISTAYGIHSYCIYRGYRFGCKSFGDKCFICGGTDKLYKKFKMNMREPGYYEKKVQQDEVERIWEIRTPSPEFPALPEAMRNGQYAVYGQKEYPFSGDGISGLFLLSEDKADLEKGFNMDMGYKSFITKKVEWKGSAPHYIITLCQYKGYEFQAIRRNGSQVLIHTNYHHIFEALQPQLFVPEEGVYEAWVEEKELEKLWEEQMPYEE
jgi:hypothetical protein